MSEDVTAERIAKRLGYEAESMAHATAIVTEELARARPALSDETLWAIVHDFARQAGYCARSDEWHEAEPCLTCQELVNLVRAVLAREQAGG